MAKKVLIAYYSRRGENYVNGSIRNLKLGNTEVVAQKIKALLPDADLLTFCQEGEKKTCRISRPSKQLITKT